MSRRIFEEEIYHLTEGHIKTMESLKKDHPQFHEYFKKNGYQQEDKQGNPLMYYERSKFFDTLFSQNLVSYIASGLGLIGFDEPIWDYFLKYGLSSYSSDEDIREIIQDHQEVIFKNLSERDTIILQDSIAYSLSESVCIVSDTLIMIN